MTSTWASYLVALATALAAAVALMGAVVVLLVGRVAELHCRVAALVPPETGLSGLPDLGGDAWSDSDRPVMDVPRQRTIGDQRGVSQQADFLAETARSGAGVIRRHHGQRPGRRPGPLRGAPCAGITVGGVWRGRSER